MRMTIRYQSGLLGEAVLLAANRERMRVAVDSQRDTIELHKVDACWYTEEGAGIEIESLIPISGTDVSRFCDLNGCGSPSIPNVTPSNCTRLMLAGTRRRGLELRLSRSSRFRELTSHASARQCTLGQMRPGAVLCLPNYQAVPSAADLRGRYQRDVKGEAMCVIRRV